MDNSARPKLTIEEFPSVDNSPGIMQPQPPKPQMPHQTAQQVYVKPEESHQVFTPNSSPVGYAGDPLNPNTPSTATPQLFGKPMPPAPAFPVAPQPTVVKQSSGLPFPVSSLKFVIPAVLVLLVIVAGAVFIPQYLSSLNKEEEFIPEPSLVPATPLPTPDISPRTRNYLDVDKEITFDYLSSFTLIECTQKIVFSTTKPEDTAELCANDKSGSMEMLVSSREIQAPEGYDQLNNVIRINSESGDKFLLVALFDDKYEQLYKKVTETVKFINPNLTEGWEKYTSTSGYVISYPSDWSLIAAEDREGSKVTEIRKVVTETRLHNLAIKMTPNVSNAGLSASEIITSLQGLSGWKERPTVEFRVLGGEVAQVIQGEYEGVWKANVVVWKGNSLVEMTWQDELPQPERLIFEGLLSTFSFAR